MSRRNIIALAVVGVLALAAIGIGTVALVTHDRDSLRDSLGDNALTSPGRGSAEGQGMRDSHEWGRGMHAMNRLDHDGGIDPGFIFGPIALVVLVAGGVALFFALRRRPAAPVGPASDSTGGDQPPAWFDHWHHAAHSSDEQTQSPAADVSQEAVTAETAAAVSASAPEPAPSADASAKPSQAQIAPIATPPTPEGQEASGGPDQPSPPPAPGTDEDVTA